MDISVNKPAKDYLRRQFDQWYSDQVLAQLEGEDVADLEALEHRPVCVSSCFFSFSVVPNPL